MNRTITYPIKGLVTDPRFGSPAIMATEDVVLPVWGEFQWGDTDTSYWQEYIPAIMKQHAANGLLTYEQFTSWWNSGYNVTLKQYLDYLGVDELSLISFLKSLNNRPQRITFGVILSFFDKVKLILTAMRNGVRIKYNPRMNYLAGGKTLIMESVQVGSNYVVTLSNFSGSWQEIPATAMVFAFMSKIVADVPLTKLKLAVSKVNIIRKQASARYYVPAYPERRDHNIGRALIHTPLVHSLIALADELGVDLPVETVV